MSDLLHKKPTRTSRASIHGNNRHSTYLCLAERSTNTMKRAKAHRDECTSTLKFAVPAAAPAKKPKKHLTAAATAHVAGKRSHSFFFKVISTGPAMTHHTEIPELLNQFMGDSVRSEQWITVQDIPYVL